MTPFALAGALPAPLPLVALATDTPTPLERILREHARALERLVASYARASADRDDLRQDIALALCTALPSFRGECSERTFVLRVAHHRAVRFLARRRLAPVLPDEPLGSGEGPRDPRDTSSKSPAVTYERRAREHALLAAVRALPVPARQVVTLLLEGLSHQEIAAVLGTTENNVAVRASRARAALRVLLDEPAPAPSPPAFDAPRGAR